MQTRKSTEFEILRATKSKNTYFGLAALYYIERSQELIAVVELKEPTIESRKRKSWCDFFCRKQKSDPDQLYKACIKGKIEIPLEVKKHDITRKIVFAKNKDDIDSANRYLRNDICLYRGNKIFSHPKIILISFENQSEGVNAEPIKKDTFTQFNFDIYRDIPKASPGESAPAIILERLPEIVTPYHFLHQKDLEDFFQHTPMRLKSY